MDSDEGGTVKEPCACGLSWADLMNTGPVKDLGFRKVICEKCGKEFYTDIKDKVKCFECEK